MCLSRPWWCLFQLQSEFLSLTRCASSSVDLLMQPDNDITICLESFTFSRSLPVLLRSAVQGLVFPPPQLTAQRAMRGPSVSEVPSSTTDLFSVTLALCGTCGPDSCQIGLPLQRPQVFTQSTTNLKDPWGLSLPVCSHEASNHHRSPRLAKTTSPGLRVHSCVLHVCMQTA